MEKYFHGMPSPYTILDACLIAQIFLCPVPGRPSITTVNPSTFSIFLSWSVPSGSVVTSYEVMWTSGECPGGVLNDSTTITGSSLSHTISGLRGGTTYTITVTVTNPAGSTSSNPMTGETEEYGEYMVKCCSVNLTLVKDGLVRYTCSLVPRPFAGAEKM